MLKQLILGSKKTFEKELFYMSWWLTLPLDAQNFLHRKKGSGPESPLLLWPAMGWNIQTVGQNSQGVALASQNAEGEHLVISPADGLSGQGD